MLPVGDCTPAVGWTACARVLARALTGLSWTVVAVPHPASPRATAITTADLSTGILNHPALVTPSLSAPACIKVNNPAKCRIRIRPEKKESGFAAANPASATCAASCQAATSKGNTDPADTSNRDHRRSAGGGHRTALHRLWDG